MICPKCHYQRQDSDTAPDWQCPSCSVAYVKAAAAIEQARQAALARPATAYAAVDRYEPEREAPTEPTSRAMQIVGTLAGLVASRYLGVQLFVPLILSGIAWWLSSGIGTRGGARFRGAFAVQVGHAIWLGIGLIGMHQLNANLLDLVWYGVGLVWLANASSAGPLYLLGIYQVLSLLVNAYMFSHAPTDSVAFKALIVHMLWRVTSIVLMMLCWLDVRRQRQQAG